MREQLLAAIARDDEVRARLAETGALFDGYNAEMEAVHVENARILEEIIDARGWPDAAMVGEDGAEAAFLILQHAISRPDLMRRCLGLIENARHAAYLADRIAVQEERPQRYGTQFDWDADGVLSPAPIDDVEGVDARRAAIGLPPLAEKIAQMREAAAAEGERKPVDFAKRRAEQRAWAIRVGWLPQG